MSEPLLRTCPMCGAGHSVELPDSALEGYRRWRRGEELIQNALPDLSREDREKLKTGYCSDCQRQLFSRNYA